MSPAAVVEVLTDLGCSAISHGQREMSAFGHGAHLRLRQERSGSWQVDVHRGAGGGPWSATFWAAGARQMEERLRAALELAPAGCT